MGLRAEETEQNVCDMEDIRRYQKKKINRCKILNFREKEKYKNCSLYFRRVIGEL